MMPWRRNRRSPAAERWLRQMVLGFSLACAALLTACGTPSSSGGTPPAATIVPASSSLPTPVSASPPNIIEFVPGEAEPQLPATVVDYQGAQVTITSIERIVSLNGDITEIIFALGMGDYVVGVDSSATYPPERTKTLPNIGYQRQLNAEGILALNPTLVIGDEAAGPPEALAQIRAAGVPLAITADPPTLEAPAQKIRFVAQALGIPQRGERLAAQVETEITRARDLASRITSPPHVLFLYLRGTDVQQVAGVRTPVDVMITAAGGLNAGAEAGIVEFKPLSPEVVIAAQPDVILVLTKGLESVGGVDGLLTIPGLADTPAGKQRRVIALDDLYLLGMGPRTGQALADLATAFYEIAQQEKRP
ncbi:MAG: hemin ABC transporter substrate-binding protein [Roseiflexus sp.]|nr:hemin ABC transporter substrate-binding protein [Roseiflexus sp.]